MTSENSLANKCKLSLSCLIAASCCSMPAQAVDGLTFSGGEWDGRDDRYGYRIAPRWDWSKALYEASHFDIKGYWEASLAYWKADNVRNRENDELWVAAASPMIQFQFNQWESLTPFAEIGIGVAAMTDDKLGNRNLGSHYHFEDKLGFGITSKTKHKFEIAYRYFHYSNAKLSSPNEGLDFHTINFSVFFK